MLSYVVNSCLVLQVICCVDKQGVLSWPNPSPETVLFFSGRMDQATERHEDVTDQLSLHTYCQTEMEDEVLKTFLCPADVVIFLMILVALNPVTLFVFPATRNGSFAGRHRCTTNGEWTGKRWAFKWSFQTYRCTKKASEPKQTCLRFKCKLQPRYYRPGNFCYLVFLQSSSLGSRGVEPIAAK